MPSLFDEAQKKILAKDYVGAREAYRNTAQKVEPSETDINFLSSAEKHEILAFRQALRAKHPQSLFIWLAEMQAYLSMKWRRPVIDLVTEALNLFPDIVEQFMLRSIRLNATCDCYYEVQQYTPLILEDIHALWQVDSNLLIDPRDKGAFLSQLISSLESRHLSILETLAQDEVFPTAVQQAFKAKITQLRALDDALKTL